MRQFMSYRKSRLALALASLGLLATTASAAVTPSDIMGFEQLAGWVKNGGVSSLSTDRTQGAASLLVSKFWSVELQTPKFILPGTITNELGLDFKAPATTQSGSISLVATAPSANTYEQVVGQVNLQAGSSGSWTTLHFPLSATIKAVFAKKPSDLQFKLRLNLPLSDVGYRLDNLRFLSGTPAPSKVEVRVPLADDMVYMEVNGIRRRIGYWGQPDSLSQWRDVTRYFQGGANQVKVRAINYGGPSGLRFELRVDGGAPLVLECPSAKCLANIDNGPFVEQAIAVPSLNLPAAQSVTITAAEAGKIYVDDEFTGLTSPATLKMPQGSYKIGYGVSTDIAPNYVGRFYEKNIKVAGAALQVDMGTQTAPLPIQYTTRIAILPVGRATMGDRTQVGILTQAMVDKFKQQVQNTRNMLFKPFSYGLADWDVTVLPIETEIAMDAPTAMDVIDYSGAMVSNPKYQNLLNQYNFVIVIHSTFDADGNFIAGMGNRAGSGGQVIGFPINWSTMRAATDPSDGLLHEVLHQYEGGSDVWHHMYTGLSGLHGAEVHGFTPFYGATDSWNNTQEWLAWYRTFIRGQAGESFSLQGQTSIPAPLTNPGYYVGTFSSIRYGLRTPAPR